mgnify:CR=1 FL=1
METRLRTLEEVLADPSRGESLPGLMDKAIGSLMSVSGANYTLDYEQAIPPVVPALGNYLIAMFKDTPLLAAITDHAQPTSRATSRRSKSTR